ncbi:MAG: CocE/NonD family hydrolase C-terminal non-catalytic domain-containing protein, partial [Gammaproteobacteria bacterium]
DPAFRVYVMDSVRPHGWYTERAGRWYSVAAWPDAQTSQTTFNLTEQGLRSDVTSEGSILIHSPLNVGVTAGEYCAIWLGPEMPVDQRLDDGGSQVFDSEPLSDEIAIVGAPELKLSVSADASVAQLAVRLCDVWPDGASTRITYGVLNLTHRDSHEHPEALEPGVAYEVCIKLDDIGYRVPAGHRLRIAVSTAYWPLIWPSPTNAPVTLHLANSSLMVPTLPAEAEAVEPFGPATSAEPLRETMIRSGSNERVASYDMATNTHTVEILADFGERRIDTLGLVTGSIARETFSVVPEDPNSARAKTHWTETVARDGWRTRTETFTSQTSDANNFYLTARVEAYEDESLVFEREWSKTVPRNLV